MMVDYIITCVRVSVCQGVCHLRVVMVGRKEGKKGGRKEGWKDERKDGRKEGRKE